MAESNQTETLESNEGTEAVAETTDTEISELSETDSLKAEVDKWKSLSRKNEQQAKSNGQAAKELDEIRKSQLTDTEKLIEQTREETSQVIRKEFAVKLVDAELKSLLNGRSLDGSSLLDFDKASFILSDGNIDSEAIQSWVEAHSRNAEQIIPDLGQGARGQNPSKSQIRSRDELKSMSPTDIMKATKDGRLDALMGKL
jgi:arsenate reductase-like glutaredoxin family protein